MTGIALAIAIGSAGSLVSMLAIVPVAQWISRGPLFPPWPVVTWKMAVIALVNNVIFAMLVKFGLVLAIIVPFVVFLALVVKWFDIELRSAILICGGATILNWAVNVLLVIRMLGLFIEG